MLCFFRKLFKSRNFLNLVATSLFIIWLSSPFLFRNTSSVIVLLVFAFWCLTSLLYGRIKGFSFVPCGFILLWFGYILLYRLIGKSTASMGNYYSQFFFWFCVIVFIHIRNAYSQEEKRFIYYLIWIATLINIVSNIFLLKRYPTAATDIYRDYGSFYLSTNVGTVTFSVFAALFCVQSIYLLFKTDKMPNRILCLVALAVSLIYLFMIQKALTFLFLGIILFLWLIKRFLNKKRTKGQIIVFVGFIVFAIVFIYVLLPILIASFEANATYKELTTRLTDIYNLACFRFDLIDSQGSGGSRLSLMIQSLRVWTSSVSSFFLGVGDVTREAVDISANSAGMHSESIDCLARYGLIGFLLYLPALLGTFHYYIKITKNDYLKYVYVACFIYSFFNSFTANSCLGLYLFISLPILMSQKKSLVYSKVYEKICNFC